MRLFLKVLWGRHLACPVPDGQDAHPTEIQHFCQRVAHRVNFIGFASRLDDSGWKRQVFGFKLDRSPSRLHDLSPKQQTSGAKRNQLSKERDRSCSEVNYSSSRLDCSCSRVKTSSSKGDRCGFEVQIPIAEFEQIEEVLENYGLVQLMNAEADEESERLSKADALEYYRSLKPQNIDQKTQTLICERIAHRASQGNI